MRRLLSALFIGLVAWACTDEASPTTNTDNFDRNAVLVNWADNIIIPSYENYSADVDALVTATNQFEASATLENLEQLQSAWLTAYTSWQQVSMFEIGKAEELSLRSFTNIYPTDSEEIESFATTGNYDLTLPSSRDAQGFPAIDYLINGSATTHAGIVERFNNETTLSAYLSDVVVRLNTLTDLVLDDWKNGYRDTFVSNDGSDANSSLNKLVNDYMFYYEKHLRAGKIGIPAGVFSNNKLSSNVEAYYKKDVSKQLFEASLQATINFFNGKNFEGNETGPSLKSYLDFLNTITEGEKLSDLINNQFTQTQVVAADLNNNFYEQVENNNEQMLLTYNELQENVVLMKVDMFQALNVKVDFVDADGD